MTEASEDISAQIAQRFCAKQGPGWSFIRILGTGGTAPVFEVQTPSGPRALKVYDLGFSSGEKGKIEEKRIQQQVDLGQHGCPSLVEVNSGGRFEDRLFLLMSRAPGRELEKRLTDIPRDRIRSIVRQVAEAAILLRQKDLCHRDIKSANVFVSDDFSTATLLDISVIRNVHDPIGVGTDHDGVLPVVATARYSPPEYLFRLLDPGPELWHALTVYQLGGLLHDLVMRVPMFQTEFVTATVNRYRFAWIVATSTPKIDASDVDGDLRLLAARALDKNWERRSQISFEDFLLDDPGTRRKNALRGLGLMSAPQPMSAASSARLERLRQVADAISKQLVKHFGALGARVRHQVKHGARDSEKAVVLSWSASPATDAPMVENEFTVNLALDEGISGGHFSVVCALSSRAGETKRHAKIALPDVPDEVGAELTVVAHAQGALDQLAEELQKPLDLASGD